MGSVATGIARGMARFTQREADAQLAANKELHERLIAGFEHPTDGHIYLNGEVISHLPPNKRPVNMVFQKYGITCPSKLSRKVRKYRWCCASFDFLTISFLSFISYI